METVERGALLRRRADEVFEHYSPYPGDGLRNHCRRLFRFATMHLQRDGAELDDDLAYAVAMVHDLGLLSQDDLGKHYMARSAALFTRLFAPHLEPQDPQLQIAEQCLLYNHRLLPKRGVCRQAELFRRAVWTEHSLGKKRYGLERAAVQQVFDELPRDNFDMVLRDFTKRVMLSEPLSVVRGIFF